MASAGPDLRALEQRIATLQAQLAQAQKLTALGELVSTTTHEFNNVLTTIINYAKLGLRNQDPETCQKSFEKILAAGQRAARITNGILGFARNRTPGFEATDLVKVIDDTLLLLEREMAKYRVSIEQRIEPAPLAWANTNQIQQVVMNLLVNARQAMSQGGRIVVGLRQDPETGMVELSIRDFGPGIEADVLRHIFEPFFSTKSGPDETGKGGSGLGLATCRDIIEAHQGRIRVESTVGKGTAFTIRLPAAPQTPEGSGGERASLPAAASGASGRLPKSVAPAKGATTASATPRAAAAAATARPAAPPLRNAQR